MPTRKRRPVTSPPAAAHALPAVTTAGSTDRLLIHAVGEAASLLDADGAMVYLLDPASGILRFAHDAGIESDEARQMVRRIELPVGVGMFGRAVAERSVVKTDDYGNDPSFPHAADADRVVADVGIRSMVVAPLVSGNEVFGALGTFSARPAAFDRAQIALVRALADHAAAAMANARLIEDLDRSRSELAQRAEIERSLREIAARISAAADLEAVLQRSVDEAARLLAADTARIDLIDPELHLLRWAYASGAERPSDDIWPDDPDETLDQGISGQAVTLGRPFWTGNYVEDDRFPHGMGSDQYARTIGINSVLAAPLIGESGPFGALTVLTSRPDAWDATDAEVLAAIADQAAITITTARLIDELGRNRTSLARRADAEQALREIAARITAIRDPADLLQHVVDEATRLVGADGAILDVLDPVSDILHWSYDSGLSGTFTPEERAELWIELGVGATGRALAEGRVIVAGDDLSAEFPPSPQSELFFGRTGYRSMIAAPIAGEAGRLGVLEVYSTRPNAFSAVDGDLIRGLASQAAIAITNARLIEQLARSREEQARTAEAERALREIAARMTAMRDQDEILKVINDEAARLLRGSGSMINLTDSSNLTDAWVHLPGQVTTVRERAELLQDVEIEPEAGVSGLAFMNRRTEWTDDYLRDDRFTHTPERDAFVREVGIRSVISAPLGRDGEVLGVLTVYSDALAAFGPQDATLLEALADQGAVTIMNARLIEALERSREEVARRADSERTLREIAARVSVILDPGEVLQQIVEEAARLLASDGARIDLFDESLGALRWAYAAGDAMREIPDWGREGGLKPRQAVAGLAYAEQRPIMTTDFLADDRFESTPAIEAFVRAAGIRAVIAAPLAGDLGSLGTISVVSRAPGAYTDADAELLTGLATHASIALNNARLMQELERSRAVIERRAEAEQALREIATRITAIRESGDLLQHVIDEAARLLRADGAMIDLYDAATETLQWAYDAGLPDEQRESVKTSRLKVGEGVSGKAVAERRVIVVDDYATDTNFVHAPGSDALAQASGIRSLIAAPIIGEEGPLGALEVFRHAPGAFSEIDAAVLGGLADQAAVAMTNARLIGELASSQAAVARRADTERSLRDITARITSLRDPGEVLERVVEEAKRLLGSDGAHLTRMSEDGTYLQPVVVAGGDAETAEWIKTQRFPLGGGINGLAAQQARPISTRDYALDDRIPHEPGDAAADRLGLRGMAAAPLRAPGGEVIGTLAISYRAPRDFESEELDLLQGLADQAAIALTNSNLVQRLTTSESRYRHLVQNSPDLVYSIGPDARLTFVSDTCERLTGWRPEELLGKHFGALVHESSREIAEIDWASDLVGPTQELRGRVNLLRRDGSPVPAEFTAMATLDADGRFAGANGSVRDMTETDRLERELRESENRYRDLASSSPDMVFATDPEGRYTFLSDAATKILGWDRERALGRPFADFVPEHALPLAAASFQELLAAPDRVQHSRIPFLDGDGKEVPLDINVIGSLEDGRLTAIHGVARDVSERERLERELQESEARFRQLVQTTPDVIWRADADGRFTFVADRAEELFGWRPDEIVGHHFGFLTLDESLAEAAADWQQLAREPDVVQHRNYTQRRKDGTTFRAEITAIGLTEGGQFVGAQGTVRDISERDRLERELRRQAGELASSEERSHLARELHDSVTQALFSMTLVARSVELLLERDPEAARKQLSQLRELQREALAEMRALIFELRPGNVEQDGLEHALRTHTAALQGRIGLPIVVESELDERLPVEVEETLYRISQEALHNVVKHAAARQVRLEIRRVRDGVRLRIEDDGKGFDPLAVPDGHLGLAGMRARAAKIDAELECRSEPGRGTMIEVRISDTVLDRFPASSRPTSIPQTVR